MRTANGEKDVLCHFVLLWYSRNRTVLPTLCRSSPEDTMPHLLLIHRSMHVDSKDHPSSEVLGAHAQGQQPRAAGSAR